ncbi:MAG: hypothetical protein ACLQLG_17370 [Thermoguttaceae bacterium]
MSVFPGRTAVFALLVLAAASPAWGGGGPENLLLVVNPQSPASLTIANHYIRLRQVPSANVIYVPWDPKAETTDIDTFRQRILRPVMAATRSRRPADQIDYVVYSSDFPWGIRLDADLKKFEPKLLAAIEAEAVAAGKDSGAAASWLKVYTPVGSLTGLTYLWEPVLLDVPAYLKLHNNLYVPKKDGATRAFASSQHYTSPGQVTDGDGVQYMLSVMLGVTSGRGNSLAEVLAYLRRSAAADGAHPKGTIYYCRNRDIRSLVRQAGFPDAVRALEALGVSATIVEGVLPSHEDDVQGLMTGVAAFDWKGCASTILPGAICEHFTSFGGVMSAGASQTPLSEFLRYGAAGASGTVAEPYAKAEKFPHPMLQVHYARGCTLAEAFYQSVCGPYQLLIVGDPLCRPWANIPKVTVAGLPADAALTGTLALEPAATFPRQASADHFELFVDGVRTLRCLPGQPLELDTASMADGYHELRVVAVEAGPIRSQGRWIQLVKTANYGRTIEVSASPPHTVRPGGPLAITAHAPGCAMIAVFEGNRVVGKIAGPQGRVEIDPHSLGSGPVCLRVMGLSPTARNNVVARPLELEVRD